MRDLFLSLFGVSQQEKEIIQVLSMPVSERVLPESAQDLLALAFFHPTNPFDTFIEGSTGEFDRCSLILRQPGEVVRSKTGKS